MDQKIDQKKEAKRSKKTNEREKEEIASSPHQSSQNTHALLHSIYLKHHGHHVREIVPAPLFEEGNAHFDGALRRRSGFSREFLAVSFSFIFSLPREFRSFVVGEKEQRRRGGEIFESR